MGILNQTQTTPQGFVDNHGHALTAFTVVVPERVAPLGCVSEMVTGRLSVATTRPLKSRMATVTGPIEAPAAAEF